jgi:hypothetical protein
MLINYSKSERGSVTLSPWVSLCRGTMGVGRRWKGTMVAGGAFDGVVLWLRRMQNGVSVEWLGEWPRLRWYFYSSRGWESGGLGRVTDSSGANSILRFWLEMGDDGMKRCRKMKLRPRARLGSMERKCDTTRWHGDVYWRRGGTR